MVQWTISSETTPRAWASGREKKKAPLQRGLLNLVRGGLPGLASRLVARRCGVRRGRRSTGPSSFPGSPRFADRILERAIFRRLRVAMLQAEFLELAIEGGAADAQAPRHFRHMAVIAGDGHADDLRFHLFELADMAGAVHHIARIGRNRRRCRRA